MPALWRNIEARRQERYERRKIATQKAAAAKAEEEETLRRKMEAGKARQLQDKTKITWVSFHSAFTKLRLELWRCFGRLRW